MSMPTRSCGSPNTRASWRVKEASGNLEQIARICRDRPRDVAVLAGDDAWTLPVLAMGGDGVVSVAVERDPGRARRALRSRTDRRLGRRPPDPRAVAAALPGELQGWSEPGPGQGRAALMGLLETDAVRAPLLPLDDGARAALSATLRGLGLVEAAGGRIGDRRAAACRGMPRRAARPSHRSRLRRPVERRQPRSTLEAGRLRARRAGPGCAGRLAGPDRGEGGDPRPVRRPHDDRLVGRAVHLPRPGGACRRATWPADRGGSCPGGTAVRSGAHLGSGVVVMPPSYVNVGAWIGQGTMVDSHVLVGSCAQIGARRPPVGRRDDRWRPRAAGRAPGHRRGRRVRRRRECAARRRARRSSRRHRGRRDADRNVAAVRPRAGPSPRGHRRRAARGAARRRGRARGRASSTGGFAREHGLSVSCRAPREGPRRRDVCSDGARGDAPMSALRLPARAVTRRPTGPWRFVAADLPPATRSSAPAASAGSRRRSSRRSSGPRSTSTTSTSSIGRWRRSVPSLPSRRRRRLRGQGEPVTRRRRPPRRGSGLGADVASGGELATALRAGIPAERIVMTGPGKRDDELAAAVEAGIRAITVESPGELARLERDRGGRSPGVQSRSSCGPPSPRTPGSNGSASSATTAPGKFGMDAGDLRNAARTRGRVAAPRAPRRACVRGFERPRRRGAHRTCRSHCPRRARELALAAGTRVRLVDAGGGLGIPYEPHEDSLDLGRLGRGLDELARRLGRRPAHGRGPACSSSPGASSSGRPVPTSPGSSTQDGRRDGRSSSSTAASTMSCGPRSSGRSTGSARSAAVPMARRSPRGPRSPGR